MKITIDIGRDIARDEGMGSTEMHPFQEQSTFVLMTTAFINNLSSRPKFIPKSRIREKKKKKEKKKFYFHD